MLSLCLQAEVNGIQTHQRLAALDVLTGIDQTFKDFALHSETEIALNAGDNNAGKGAGGIHRTHYSRRPDQRRLSAGIVCAGNVTAGREGKRQQANGKRSRLKPEHGVP
ncbi:hypothetical protein NUKP39_27020 [Klebsiella variicola]|nr:hypothetical protein NUKP39_27020 [Klebsiella variicola]